MRVDAVTIFPDYLAPLRQSLLGKAAERGLLRVQVHDLRRWTHDRHRTVDDTPYGAERMRVDELSLGDYVLSGGEVAVLAIVEAVARLLPGVVGNPDSLAEESHAGGLLEYPVYTRPPSWRGYPVPDVLLSGDHGAIARWRRDQALRRTAARRPDLLQDAALTERDRAALD